MLGTTYEVAERYAQALFDLGIEENELNKVKEDIFFVDEVLQSSIQLKEFLQNPFGEKGARQEVVLAIFKNKISETCLNFVLLLVEKRLEKLLPLIVNSFKKLFYEKQSIVEISVTTARKLSDSEYDKISERLAKTLNKPVVLKKLIDEKIIGGIIIQYNDKLINGSIQKRLQDVSNLSKKAMLQKGAFEVV